MMVIGRKGTADSTSDVCPNQYQSTTHTYRRKKNKRQTKLDYLLMENMFRLQMSLMPRPYGDFDMNNIRYLCSMLKWKNMIILMEIDVGSTMSALEQDSPAPTHTHNFVTISSANMAYQIPNIYFQVHIVEKFTIIIIVGICIFALWSLYSPTIRSHL